jgi:hypothetical protein
VLPNTLNDECGCVLSNLFHAPAFRGGRFHVDLDPVLTQTEETMKILLAGLAALSLASGAAWAQTASETTTTQQNTMAPAMGASSETRTTHVQDAYGDSKYSKSSTTQDANGVTKSTVTKTQIAAPPPPPVTTSTTTETQSTTGPQ